MILEDATFAAFGYEVFELKPHSSKPILVACDDCGTVRETSKNKYHALCNKCAKTGVNNPQFNKTGEKSPRFNKKHTKEAKAKMSAAAKKRTGKKNSMFGKKRREESKAKMRGKNNPNYNGGKKLSEMRHRAKRRELGSNILMPLKEGEDGHHLTDRDIIGVPKDVHEKLSGGLGRKKHRQLVLKWLKDHDTEKYKIALIILVK